MAHNILVICSDQHWRDAAGCYGHPLVKTPNMDRLAARGTLFTRAYCADPCCVSTRASIQTGVRDDALAALRRDAPDLPESQSLVSCLACARPYHVPRPQFRSRLLCPACVVRAVATALCAHADSSRSPRSSCVVCRGAMSRRAGALTCSDRCRVLLYRARRRVASLAASSSGSSPDVELFVADALSPAQRGDACVPAETRSPFDDSRERPASNGVAPAGADAPGVSALRDAVAALAAAGVAADAGREATAARCSALVEGVAAAVADCARAFADAGCAVEAERYRSVARAGFDVAGFRARLAAARVEVRVSPLGGVCTVHRARWTRARAAAFCALPRRASRRCRLRHVGVARRGRPHRRLRLRRPAPRPFPSRALAHRRPQRSGVGRRHNIPDVPCPATADPR